MKKNFFIFLCVVLTACSNRQIALNSQPTSIEPLPIKFGGFKDSAVEVAVPLKTEKKKTGGFRSPVEVRFRVLMTNWDVVRIPIMPTGASAGVRFRW